MSCEGPCTCTHHSQTAPSLPRKHAIGRTCSQAPKSSGESDQSNLNFSPDSCGPSKSTSSLPHFFTSSRKAKAPISQPEDRCAKCSKFPQQCLAPTILPLVNQPPLLAACLWCRGSPHAGQQVVALTLRPFYKLAVFFNALFPFFWGRLSLPARSAFSPPLPAMLVLPGSSKRGGGGRGREEGPLL
jgi:hypothetical protein